MLFVFISTRAGNEDIVNVHVGVLKREATKNSVDETLKCLCCVAQTKWHLCKFVEFEGSCYGHLMDISWLHRDLVVTLHQIQL